MNDKTRKQIENFPKEFLPKKIEQLEKMIKKTPKGFYTKLWVEELAFAKKVLNK